MKYFEDVLTRRKINVNDVKVQNFDSCGINSKKGKVRLMVNTFSMMYILLQNHTFKMFCFENIGKEIVNVMLSWYSAIIFKIVGFRHIRFEIHVDFFK